MDKEVQEGARRGLSKRFKVEGKPISISAMATW
jgi:hypothetical protein